MLLMARRQMNRVWDKWYESSQLEECTMLDFRPVTFCGFLSHLECWPLVTWPLLDFPIPLNSLSPSLIMFQPTFEEYGSLEMLWSFPWGPAQISLLCLEISSHPFSHHVCFMKRLMTLCALYPFSFPTSSKATKTTVTCPRELLWFSLLLLCIQFGVAVEKRVWSPVKTGTILGRVGKQRPTGISLKNQMFQRLVKFRWHLTLPAW